MRMKMPQNSQIEFRPDSNLSPDQVEIISSLTDVLNSGGQIIIEKKPTKKQQNEKLLEFFKNDNNILPLQLNNDNVKIELSRLFQNDDQIDPKVLFLLTYNKIPNWTAIYSIDCLTASNYLINNYKNDIKNYHYVKSFEYSKSPNSKKVMLSDLYFYLDHDVIIHFNLYTDDALILYCQNSLSYIEKIFKDLTQFKAKREYDKPEINLLTQGRGGLELTPLEITKPKFSIKDNYNDDFIEVYHNILKRLKKKNDKGIVLLHGKPGTGKSSLIKFLINTVKKDVIFLPPTLAASLTDPSLIKVLIDNPNSILVIEDAELVVTSRKEEIGNSAAVSTILNLTDGLLSDVLCVQILTSFNTDLTKIDPALRRKGRMIDMYEFKELSKEKTQALSNKLGFKKEWTEGATLASIYCQDDPDHMEKERKKIGF